MLNCLLDSSAAQKHPLYRDIFTGILFFRQDILQSVILNKLHCKKVVGRWLVSGRPTTYSPTTYRPHTNHLPTTYRPRTDHVPTTYRPLFYGAACSILPLQSITILWMNLLFKTICLTLFLVIFSCSVQKYMYMLDCWHFIWFCKHFVVVRCHFC